MEKERKERLISDTYFSDAPFLGWVDEDANLETLRKRVEIQESRYKAFLQETMLKTFTWIFCGVLLFTLLIFVLQGFSLWGFNLNPTILNLLGVSTIGEVAGLLALLFKVYFGPEKISKSNE